MGEVCKEFYDLSRDEYLWKIMIEKDFPFVLSGSQDEIYAGKEYGRFTLYDQEISKGEDPILYNKYLHVYRNELMKISVDSTLNSFFCKYWYLRNELIRNKYEEPIMISI